MGAMPRLQRKSFVRPDRVRALGSGRLETVDLDEAVVGQVHLPPGWHWATDVQPVVGTPSCEVRHVSYAVSGTLHVRMDDGTEMDIGAGDVHEIPPGHDAWVVGDVAYVAIEWANSARYGKSPEESGDRILATILFSDIVDFDRGPRAGGGRSLAEADRRAQRPASAPAGPPSRARGRDDR